MDLINLYLIDMNNFVILCREFFFLPKPESKIFLFGLNVFDGIKNTEEVMHFLIDAFIPGAFFVNKSKIARVIIRQFY